MKLSGLFLLLMMILSRGGLAQTLCTTPPPAEALDKQFLSYIKSQTQEAKIRLALFPFQDGSLTPPDPTLEKAFSATFYDILSANSKMGVIHPFLIFSATAPLSSADLFVDDKIIQTAKALGATHAVYGMFQKKGTGLRYFVKIAAVESGQALSPAIEFAAIQNDRFFTIAIDAATTILKTIGGQKLDPEFAKKYLEGSPSFEAYRYYVKGMEKSYSYNEVDLGVAKIWFEKATMEFYAFSRANDEVARTLLMLALIHKQMGKDPTLLIVEAQEALKRGSGIASIVSPSRWLDANRLFVEGVARINSGDAGGARKVLSDLVKKLPEDGLAHYYLAKAGGGAEEQALATQLNPCLQ